MKEDNKRKNHWEQWKATAPSIAPAMLPNKKRLEKVLQNSYLVTVQDTVSTHTSSVLGYPLSDSVTFGAWSYCPRMVISTLQGAKVRWLLWAFLLKLGENFDFSRQCATSWPEREPKTNFEHRKLISQYMNVLTCVLQDLNLFLKPMQYFPPFSGLKELDPKSK